MTGFDNLIKSAGHGDNGITPGVSMKVRKTSGMRYRVLLLVFFWCAVFLVSSCSPIGPAAVQRDRLHYSTAVADSWKEQLLLNIVKTRYGDAPMFLDVTSVVSGYTLETQIGAGFEYHPDDPEDFLTAGGQVNYTDRPTLSYAPMSGKRFATTLMAPVPLDEILFVLQQRVPADFILGLTLESIAGHHNSTVYTVSTSHRDASPIDASFRRLLRLLTDLQKARVVSTELTRSEDDTDLFLIFNRERGEDRGLLDMELELKELLGISTWADKAEVIFGSHAAEPDTIALRSRSLLQIIAILGGGVEIPDEHLDDGSALSTGDGALLTTDFTIHSGGERPADSFVSVPYGGRWFWIDRRDYASKSTLTALTVLFQFLEGGGSSVSPVLTIPVQ